MTRVALFGFYEFGNYGDDLMAVMIARRLRAAGVAVTMFGIGQDVAHANGCAAADTVDDLLAGCDALVYGGGGLLLSPSVDQISEARFPRLIEQIRAWSRKCVETADACRSRRLPVMLLSIGGSGPGGTPFRGARSLLDVASGVTIRNEFDCGVRDYTRGFVHHFPDIVLTASDLMPPASGSRDRSVRRIGIDVASAEPAVVARLDGLLATIRRRRPELRFVALDTAKRSHASYAAYAHPRLDQCHETYQFDDIDRDTRTLSTFDLVISSRLHAGVTALSYGVPFLSFHGGAGKVRAFMRAAGLEAMCVSDSDPDWARLHAMIDADDYRQLCAWDQVRRLQSDSRGHWRSLDAWLSASAGNGGRAA